MKELVIKITEIVSNKYSLDKDALLNKNSDIVYIDMPNGLIEMNKHTHLSKVISTDKKVIEIFNAIQTLLKA